MAKRLEQIKNPFLRRSATIITFLLILPLIMLVYVLNEFLLKIGEALAQIWVGLREKYLVQLVPAFRAGWRGPNKPNP